LLLVRLPDLQLDDPSLWALYTIDEDGVLNFPAGPDSVREQLRLRQQQRKEQQQQGGAEAEAQGGEVVFMRHPKVRVALLRVLLQTVLLCPALKVGVLAFKVMSQIVVKVCGKVALWGFVLQVDMFTAERYSPHHTYGGGGGPLLARLWLLT
jgi:hypothetical protein